MANRYILKSVVTARGVYQVAEPLSLWGYLVFLVKRRFEIVQPGVVGVVKR